MKNKEKEQEHFDNKSTVYGPVKSWRFGKSLGIDPIFINSTCSFNCLYCQLGHIQDITTNFKEYVSTKKVLSDFEKLSEESKVFDVITYSGSGEPSLASNLGDIVNGLRNITPNSPQLILTNGTELHRNEVRKNLLGLDRIIFKLDVGSNEMLQQMNRPANGVTLEKIVEGYHLLKEEYKGELEIQSMFMPTNQKGLEDFANLLKELSPAVVQLNTPKRPYPMEWHVENRGNHVQIFDYDTRTLKTIDKEKAMSIEDYLRLETGLEILSIYR